MKLQINSQRLVKEIESELNELVAIPMLSAGEFVIGDIDGVQIQIRMTKDSDEFLDYDEDDLASKIITSIEGA